MDLNGILARAVEAGASDIMIVAGMPPVLRIDTELTMLRDFGDVDDSQLKQMLGQILSEEQIKALQEQRDLDFATTGGDGTRFRVNAHFQNGSPALTLRLVKSAIPDIANLGLPEVVEAFVHTPRGLVLVTGPTGSGKSTTLAAMINKINQEYARHIITIEDPVEYRLTSSASVIEQRQIGSDCPSFASALRHVLRQDPDVILVGEMRDLETTGATITAAETGHLVFSTLHTINAAQTIERIVDIYPANQQAQIRTMLANTLEAVISQTLFRRADGPGMVAAAEIMICSTAVRNCIRENRIFEIPNIIETGQRLGMQSLDQSIAALLRRGLISQDQALAKCSDPASVEKHFNSLAPAAHAHAQRQARPF